MLIISLKLTIFDTLTIRRSGSRFLSQKYQSAKVLKSETQERFCIVEILITFQKGNLQKNLNGFLCDVDQECEY
jgi:hypothetical protein